MEQTLGKRIAAQRKALGLTQEQLADQLGITAQAVSKWENNQSCPDIAMLPRLADIFGVTTDMLLGHSAPESAQPAEPADEEAEKSKDRFEFRWVAGRKDGVLFAICVLLVGSLTLLSRWYGWGASFGEILWPSILLVYGLREMISRFSVFHLALTIFGGYSLGANLNIWHLAISRELVFPICVILFGLGLLINALRKPKESRFVMNHRDGKRKKTQWTCDCRDEHFDCSLSFGDQYYQPALACLAEGSIELNFGNLTVDLTNCMTFRENCNVNVECNFGDVVLRVPRQVRIVHSEDSSCGTVSFSGQPDPVTTATVHLDADVSFGQLRVEYI